MKDNTKKAVMRLKTRALCDILYKVSLNSMSISKAEEEVINLFSLEVALEPYELAQVIQALGIAERQFSSMHEQAIKLANVRNCENETQYLVAQNYHDLACEFAELNIKLNKLKK